MGLRKERFQMKYIDLNKVTAEDVTGRWKVLNRVVNPGNEDSVFADVHLIEFELDYYKSVNGKELIGIWTVRRENSIIYNPQLQFFIDNDNIGNAIITR